jgi:hypothetical protein
MQALRGSIQLVGSEQSGWLVQNGTDLALQDAGVIRRNQNGRLETAWLGSLEPAASVPLKYQTSEKSVFLDAWKDSPTCYSYERRQADLLSARDRNGDRALTPNEVQGVPELESQFSLFDVRPRDGRLDDKELFAWCVKSHGGQLTLGRLVDLACEARGLRTGEVRLIGWTDRNLPGLTIRPHASQERIRTLILVHLKDGRHPPAQRDENLRVAVERNPHTEPGILSEGDASP